MSQPEDTDHGDVETNHSIRTTIVFIHMMETLDDWNDGPLFLCAEYKNSPMNPDRMGYLVRKGTKC
jgi:hypothetical protein